VVVLIGGVCVPGLTSSLFEVSRRCGWNGGVDGSESTRDMVKEFKMSERPLNVGWARLAI
jgi:hypothetical protein